MFRALIAAALIAAALLALGAAPTGASPAAAGERPLPRHRAIVREAPLRLSPEARDWLLRAVPPAASPRARLERLVAALLDRGGLALDEIDGRTWTAAEAFAVRRANCVAFAHLVVAMGRSLELPLYFVLGTGIEDRSQHHDLRVAHGHLAAGYGSGDDLVVIDFAGLHRGSAVSVQPIEDRVARAVYFANRGAELLLAGDSELAVAWLQVAVELAPKHAWGWQNLSVALYRSGRQAAAELVQRRACELAPEALPRGAMSRSRCAAPR